jgi:hypothetical protein
MDAHLRRLAEHPVEPVEELIAGLERMIEFRQPHVDVKLECFKLVSRLRDLRKAIEEAHDRYPVPETVATTESGIVHPTGEKPVEYFRGYRNAAAHLREAFDGRP